MLDLAGMREAIRHEGLGGWLFSVTRGRDILSLSILGLDTEKKSSRPWYYLIFPEGEPLKIVHGIESGALAELPGETVAYSSRRELITILSGIAQKAGEKKVACQYSPELPIISYLDHGTALLLGEAGLHICSSAVLIQRFRGLLDEEGTASHNRAAVHLCEIVETVWERLRQLFAAKTPVYEGDLRDWILDEFTTRGLFTSSSPVAAAGAHSGDPHYGPSGRGALIEADQVVQLDLWAKETKPGGIYADISWVGYTGKEVPPAIQKDFIALVAVRDKTLEFIAKGLTEDGGVTGSEIDEYTRGLLIDGGYESGLRHRTGHGIDTECHGSGVNLDCVEFPDKRYVLDGSCFSIEPGIYFSSYGLRTEINAYAAEGKLYVSGKKPQSEFLTLASS
jgi:Xaa-Pro aminopeptidase